MNSCENTFYLIGGNGKRLVPVLTTSRKRGLRGYQLTPSGFQNDVSMATFTDSLEELVRAVVLRGMAVRAKVEKPGGKLQTNAIMLGQRVAPQYWLCPSKHHWVAGAAIQPSGPVR